MNLKFIYFLLFAIFFILCGVLLRVVLSEQPKKQTPGIFHMKYGGAYCLEFFVTSCGVTLKGCTDEKEYHCMQDVSIQLDKQ